MAHYQRKIYGTIEKRNKFLDNLNCWLNDNIDKNDYVITVEKDPFTASIGYYYEVFITFEKKNDYHFFKLSYEKFFDDLNDIENPCITITNGGTGYVAGDIITFTGVKSLSSHGFVTSANRKGVITIAFAP